MKRSIVTVSMITVLLAAAFAAEGRVLRHTIGLVDRLVREGVVERRDLDEIRRARGALRACLDAHSGQPGLRCRAERIAIQHARRTLYDAARSRVTDERLRRQLTSKLSRLDARLEELRNYPQ
jgi:hypothetical protein